MKFLMYIVAVEALTNLLTKSEFSIRFIKEPLFEAGKDVKLFEFIHDVLDCGYCTSVWSAILMATLFFTDFILIDYVIAVLVLHRMSNVLHFIIDWIDEKRSRDFEFLEKEKEEDD